MLIPTISPTDEVMVKDADGSWKVYAGGVVKEREVAPPAVAAAVAAAPRLQPRTITPSAPARSAPSRPTVQDVRPPRTVIGPVDELQMSLDEYMKLGGNATERAVRVKGKIEILGAEDYAKRLEGIASWRRSEAYRQYILLGQESVLASSTIEQTIQKKEAAGTKTLSVEDVQAIMQLNHDLRN